MSESVSVLQLQASELVSAWEACVKDAVSAKMAVEDEVEKALKAQVPSS